MGVVKDTVGGLFKPTVLRDPRSNALGDFSKLLSSGLQGGNVDIGGLLAKLGSLPGFQTQGATNPLEGQSIDASQQTLAKFLGGDQGAGILGTLQGIAGGGGGLNLPPEIASLFGGGTGSLAEQIQQLTKSQPTNQISQLMAQFTNPGLNSLQGMDYSNPFLSALGGANFASPEQTMLQQLAGAGRNPYIDQLAGGTPGIQQLLRLGRSGGDTSAQSTLQSLLGGDAASRLLGGGQGQDLNSIAAAIQQAAQPGVDRGLRDLREQFSFNGLRKSTDLNSAASDFLTNSQSQLTSQLAQIAPQLAGMQNQTSLGALQALIGGAGTQGQLGQGTLAQQIQALTSGAGLSQSGVQGAATAQNQQLGTLGQILGQAGQLGQGSQSLNLQSLLGGAGNLNSLLGIKQQGAATAGGLNVDTLRAMLGGAGQAGQLAQQGQDSSLNALQQLLGTQTQQGGILAQLFGGQQGNALQAALAQPGAFSSISQLGNLLAGQTSQIGQQGFNNQNTNIQTQLQAFLQQQSLIPQLLQFLGGTGPQQYGNSPITDLTNVAKTASVAAAAK